MPITDLTAGTPHYVLMNENRRICPTVVRLESGRECSAVYGFSDKSPYDEFCANSKVPLTPYPLVKGYLRNQTDSRGEELRLVVVDAAGPREPVLHAATMEAVLEAQENRTSHVSATLQLAFDPSANAYRVNEAVI